jgi:hypothetical protein
VLGAGGPVFGWNCCPLAARIASATIAIASKRAAEVITGGKIL